jgi:hypothetical protein
MFRSWYRGLAKRPSRQTSHGPRPRTRLQVEALEDRQLMASTITITSLALPGSATGVNQLPAATEGQASNTLDAFFTDSTAGIKASDLTATIDYGDGTPLVTASIDPAGSGQFHITDAHTFPEESGSVVPPFTFNVTLHVFENANPTDSIIQTGQAQVLDAPLGQGNPIDPTTVKHTEFTGGNLGNSTTVAQALANFRTAIGGTDNGGVAAPQNGGFRTINWDGVKLDGTDFGGPPNTTVIDKGKTVAIPLDRFQERGVFFGAIYAVSTDQQPGGAFADVNPNAAGLFTSFSPHNVFAMMNDNGIDFKFVSPSVHTTDLVSAGSRGFGAVFENVTLPNTTSIEYFHDGVSLGKFFVPVTGKGQSVFLGELFDDPIVTNVVLTLGTDVIFRFDGTTFTAGGADDPANNHNLVTVDDWVYAEPVPLANGFPIVSGAQGTANAPVIATTTVGAPFNGVVATFNDQDPAAHAGDFTATINWGDGHLTNGTITANGKGGFDVSGVNTYTHAGAFPINVDIADFGGGPGAGGSAPTLSVNNTIKVQPGSTTTTLTVSTGQSQFNQPVTLTATVHAAGDVGGTVTFYSDGTPLGTVPVGPGNQASLTTSSLPPGNHSLTAVFSGDANFQGSAGTASESVSPNVTGQFFILLGKAHKHGKHFRIKATLVYVGANALPGPVFLALDGLPNGVSLQGANGVTLTQPPPGSPFVVLNLSGASQVSPGQFLSLDLDFSAPSAGKIVFSPRLLAGAI